MAHSDSLIVWIVCQKEVTYDMMQHYAKVWKHLKRENYLSKTMQKYTKLYKIIKIIRTVLGKYWEGIAKVQHNWSSVMN